MFLDNFGVGQCVDACGDDLSGECGDGDTGGGGLAIFGFGSDELCGDGGVGDGDGIDFDFFGFVVLFELLDGDLSALLGGVEEHGEHEDHEHDDDAAEGAAGFLWWLGGLVALVVFFGLVGLVVFGIFIIFWVGHVECWLWVWGLRDVRSGMVIGLTVGDISVDV